MLRALKAIAGVVVLLTLIIGVVYLFAATSWFGKISVNSQVPGKKLSLPNKILVGYSLEQMGFWKKDSVQISQGGKIFRVTPRKLNIVLANEVSPQLPVGQNLGFSLSSQDNNLVQIQMTLKTPDTEPIFSPTQLTSYLLTSLSYFMTFDLKLAQNKTLTSSAYNCILTCHFSPALLTINNSK